MGFDIVVYGGTPGGIAAAIAGAREGHTTALVNPLNHLGGMAASGLCTTDAVRRNAFGGIVLEFIERVRRHYEEEYGEDSEDYALCRDGWYYEPSVAERTLTAMVAEERRITHLPGRRLVRSNIVGGRLREIVVRTTDGDEERIIGSVFIDASYEGDVAAKSGVPYRVGREGREEFGEEHAGIVYQDWHTAERLPESTGEPHPGIQSYCLRMALTSDPSNMLPVPKPESYEGHLPDYLPILDDMERGIVKGFGHVIAGSSIPNKKRDANGHIRQLTSFNCPGMNWDYPDGDDDRRAEIVRWHTDHAVGLLWWLQHEPRLPEKMRKEARRWGLPADEFVSSEHLPWQLYVRQARRIEGRYILTEHDFRMREGRRPPTHPDSIAVGEHSFDVHPCQGRDAAVGHVMEGVLWYPNKADGPAQPGQVPYEAIVPPNVEGLLVPVALSATHVAFSALRMEPLWMATGQAAGVAASMAIRRALRVADVPVPDLQERLVNRGQVLTYFSDLAPDDPGFRTVQLRGTSEEWDTYLARNHLRSA